MVFADALGPFPPRAGVPHGPFESTSPGTIRHAEAGRFFSNQWYIYSPASFSLTLVIFAPTLHSFSSIFSYPRSR